MQSSEFAARILQTDGVQAQLHHFSVIVAESIGDWWLISCPSDTDWLFKLQGTASQVLCAFLEAELVLTNQLIFDILVLIKKTNSVKGGQLINHLANIIDPSVLG